MSLKQIMIATSAAAACAGCGSNAHFVNHPSPPTPVNLTVYINDQRVSVSPASVGAGPVALTITNEGSRAQSVTVLPTGTSDTQPLADTGLISPRATDQITINLNATGSYIVTTAASRSTDAAAALPTGVHQALLHVGQARPTGSNALLQP